jgi:hypothetical protein
MYRIDIYDKDFNPLTTIWQQSVFEFKYTTELNKAGSAEFTMRMVDPKATATNLLLYNRVIVSRDGVGVFIGYIENLKVTLNTVTILCTGMLGLFKKRLITLGISSTTANTAVNDILTAVNAVDDTGISFGTSDVTNIINGVQLVRSSVMSAWDKLATMAGGAEFEIDTDKNFNFMTALGTDKSATVMFKYDINAVTTSTIFDFDVEVEGADIYNAVLGIGDGSITTTETDATSISEFGRLEEAKNFAQTVSATDLSKETQNYVDNRKDEFYSPKISVNTEKIGVDKFNVGDTITIFLRNGLINLNRHDRIIKKVVTLSPNNTESVSVSLMPTGSNLLPSTFQSVIIKMSERLSLLEGTL